jgi:adenine-specific DNA-methyltransferase
VADKRIVISAGGRPSRGTHSPLPPRIRYMGNKSALAWDVAQIIADLDQTAKRPLVDLFGGMCSIAGAVSPSGRQVWNNDVQEYACLVARCLLTSRDGPPSPERAIPALSPTYRANFQQLRRRFSEDLARERRVIGGDSRKKFADAQAAWRHAGNDDAIRRETERLRGQPTGPHRLATLTFAWGYFGLQQSMEIDSVRAAIDDAVATRTFTDDEAAWCRLALLQTCSRVSSSPGHFAQFLRGDTETGFRRIQTARRRSVWDGVLSDLGRLKPFGTKSWRSRNRVSTSDALTIWPELDSANVRSAIFYADPPYSKEHYSRFYHVLETLELYDYPVAVGIGRYRDDRFATPFATKRGVGNAARALFAAIAEREGTLVLSYPSSGLLTAGLQTDVSALLQEYFSEVKEAIARASDHSTLGARHGDARRQVTEYVWTAT